MSELEGYGQHDISMRVNCDVLRVYVSRQDQRPISVHWESSDETNAYLGIGTSFSLEQRG